MVTTVGGHWEFQAAALLKAVWWGMRLARLLAHLFYHFALVFLEVTFTDHFKQDVPLSQRDPATLHVFVKLILCCTIFHIPGRDPHDAPIHWLELVTVY